MKILVFSSLFPNHLQPNNAIFIKHRMKTVADEHNVEIKVVAPVPFSPPIKRFQRWYTFSQIGKHEYIDGIEVFHPKYLVTPKIGMSFYGLNMFWGALKTVREIYKGFPFDLIDAHYIFPDSFAAVLLGKVFKKPIVVSARGTDINLYVKMRVIRPLIWYTLTKSASVISVCSSLKEMMMELGIPDKKIKVIPNGIDTTEFYEIDKKEARKALGLKSGLPIVLSVGSLRELKGHHILVDALSLLKKQGGLNFLTIIVGEGEYRTIIEKKVKEFGLENDVILAGQVPNSRLVFWYNAADIFLLASSREGWPNVVCEALACGLPVVATRANGVPEIITNDDYGFLVARTPENFARGIEEALNKDWDLEKIYEYGQSRTWKNVAAEVFDVFDMVLQGG